MLSRVASNIYWMGRYLERSEQLARYTKVQYFSMYEAPSLQNKDFVLQSIINMTGIEYTERPNESLNEQEIIRKVGLDKESDSSIFFFVYSARENARSARNVLSDELWEAINTYYRYVNEFSDEYYVTRGLYEFSLEVNRHNYIIKSCINHTLLHEFGWMMISLGYYLERTIQIIRMLSNKLFDIALLSENGKNVALEEYQWTTTLKILEAFDIYRRYIKNHPNAMSQENFIIWHKSFPRSIVYNLGKVHELVTRIANWEGGHDKLIFQTGKVYNKVKFFTPEEMEDPQDFLSELLAEVYDLHSSISAAFFD